MLVVLALLPQHDAEAEQIQLQITECGTAAQPSGCSTGSRKVQRDRGEQRITVPVTPAPAPKPRAATAADGAEHHDVDLKTGEHRVRKTDGSKSEDSRVKVEVEGDRKRDAHGDGHDHAGDDAAAAVPAPKTALDPVTTTAGSPFAGFGAGMEFVSADEALSRFAIPPFLVPIYVAAGRAYDVPWNLLAAINQIETDFGRIGHQVSTAGALGWMQFMPATWKTYGVDASGDGIADPYNPVDAIYAAARYLRAGGAPHDLRRAVFAYNHADWYVDSVLKTAGIYGSLPGGLVAETGSLAYGRFPVLGRVSYGDDFRRARAAGRPARGLRIEGRPGAKAIATQSVTVRRILLDERLARAFRRHSVPRRGLRRRAPGGAPAPAGRAAADPQASRVLEALRPVAQAIAGPDVAARLEAPASKASAPARARGLRRAAAPRPSAPRAGRLPEGFAVSSTPGISVVVEDALGNTYRYGGLARVARGIRPGARVRGGGEVGRLSPASDASMLFSVRAAGGAAVDPRPLVDGYRLQEVADFQHAVAPLGGSPFVPDADDTAAAGTVRGTQSELARRVLDDPGIDIYPGGRQDVARGIIDKRVLGALLYLRRNGLELTITSLRTGHGFYTAGGSVSAHSFGAAVDIAAFNGQPVLGNQGPGSLTEQAIKLLMRLHGEAQPAQLISLMNLGGPSFAMGDHDDHLHVGYHFQPSLGLGRSGDALGSVTFDGGAAGAVLGGGKVDKGHERALAGRLGRIENPSVRAKATAAGVRVEAEQPSEDAAARALAERTRPLRTAPTAAGARLIDVDVPAGARGDEAYALGTVGGAGRDWADQQVVVLAHRNGTWRVAGPPRDARGDVANPKLVALATVPGGRGFAVGRDGTVVALRHGSGPVILGRAGHAQLAAVAARREGSRVVGTAVGARGVAVDLKGRSLRVARAASAGDRLTSVTFAGATPVAVGERSSGGPLVLRRAAGGWRALAAPAERSRVALTAVGGSSRALWVAGGIRERESGGAALPFAARFAGGGWQTFCAGAPALAAVRELGEPTRAERCDRALPLLPGAQGAAGDVAATSRGVVLSTTGGILLFDGRAFRSLPAAPGSWPVATVSSRAPRLALLTSGSGWAAGAGGRIARVTAAQDAADQQRGALRPAALTRGAPAAVAATPGGGRVLALTDRSAALRDGRIWGGAASPQLPLRDLDFPSADEAWAVAETGELLRFDGERWSGEGDDESRTSLWVALGGERFATSGAPSGLASLDFRSDDEGYAVGAGGAVARFDGRHWTEDREAEDADLLAVAAGDRGVVAGGAGGAVLERTDDGWQHDAEAERLAAGHDVTAAAAAGDGTLLLAAGPSLLARAPGEEWDVAPLAPLGVEVRELAAYRAGDGSLHAIALAGPAESATLLLGDAQGWRPLAPGGVDRVTGFDLEGDTLWATGFAADRAAVGSVAVEGLVAGSDAVANDASAAASNAAAAAVAREGAASDAAATGGDAAPSDASGSDGASASEAAGLLVGDGPTLASGAGRRLRANSGPSRFEALLRERTR
ncbi:MAG TPA: lytic transglycosylase domain-containing protein [Solirubrobacteraceae bacterium]